MKLISKFTIGLTMCVALLISSGHIQLGNKHTR